ncbi:hypothetical protein [Pontibacillus salipaludis]|uniref:Uncharacterized protein n=1 Tax=Pontibacillus salipaludis TaxID=1697394 RepID=A0ABQ1PWB1_9BACI|nr:hypothetical protein [Pontibacillus salipaludis]GGD05160.1 hypothetical protein GCM10011389_10810 [Pontibacillus salipaludis]
MTEEELQNPLEDISNRVDVDQFEDTEDYQYCKAIRDTHFQICCEYLVKDSLTDGNLITPEKILKAMEEAVEFALEEKARLESCSTSNTQAE